MPHTTSISELSENFEALRPGVPLPEVKRLIAVIVSKISRLAAADPSLAARLSGIISDLQRLYASQDALIALNNPSLDRQAAESSFYASLEMIRKELMLILTKR